MDLYRNILIGALSKQKARISFDNLKTENPSEIVEMTCYKTIKRIRKVLDNDTLDDFECIERIVKLLENMGGRWRFKTRFWIICRRFAEFVER